MTILLSSFPWEKVSVLKYPEQCASAFGCELYDKEAARVASASPFVLPPARGASEGAEVGQRLAVLERCEKDDKWRKRVDPSSVPTPPLPELGEEIVQQECSEDYSHSRHDFRDKRKRARKLKISPRQMLRAH